MKPFMDQDFLLTNETAKQLYHQVAEPLPILDYHCHLNPRDICEDRRFDNLAQLWLGEDHYKWRLMRSAGVPERYVTGNAPGREKFQRWAQTLPQAIGNPLHHWSHLELKNYFGYEGTLNGETAETVWQLCNEKLAQPDFSARNLILRSQVEVLCTTDDPADDLRWHKALAGSDFPVKVLPTFRPDRAIAIEKPDFGAYVEKLSEAADMDIDSFPDLVTALRRRADFFDSMGCRVSDQGMADIPYAPAAESAVERSFQRRLRGETLSPQEQEQYKFALLTELGRLYAEKGWVMQLRFGVIRDNAKRIFRSFGPDAGIDSIGNPISIGKLPALLNALDETDELPRTILYSLNPGDSTPIATVMGCFQGGGIPGKLQLGSAWWFNDHKQGIRRQLTALAEQGLFSAFVGMTTDSRSVLSYARHEYFRRVLCDRIGTWVEDGEYPNDSAALGRIVSGICCENARQYFRF